MVETTVAESAAVMVARMAVLKAFGSVVQWVQTKVAYLAVQTVWERVERRVSGSAAE